MILFTGHITLGALRIASLGAREYGVRPNGTGKFKDQFIILLCLTQLNECMYLVAVKTDIFNLDVDIF